MLARLEAEIARDLAKRVGKKPYRTDLCDALDAMLTTYTEEGKAALSIGDYVGAQRSVTKAYRLFDMTSAVCQRPIGRMNRRKVEAFVER